jgi:uncharacterized protein (DUF1697 family)
VPTYVALLRGVNVGGRAQVAMPALREAVTALGHEDVATYIQSGNVVFRSSSRAAGKIAAGLERGVEERFGMDVTVVIRTARELARVARSNPFLAAGADPKTLHVGCLAGRPTAAAVGRLDPQHAPPDEFVVRGREVSALPARPRALEADDRLLRAPAGDGDDRAQLGHGDEARGDVG